MSNKGRHPPNTASAFGINAVQQKDLITWTKRTLQAMPETAKKEAKPPYRHQKKDRGFNNQLHDVRRQRMKVRYYRGKALARFQKKDDVFERWWGGKKEWLAAGIEKGRRKIFGPLY